MGNRIPSLSDIIAVQTAIRFSFLQFFFPERFVPWHCYLKFRQLHLRTTQRLQQVPLVGVLHQQQRHDRPNFDVIRSLWHGNSFRYYVHKRSHELVRPYVRDLKLLLERGRKDRSGLVGVQLRRLCWTSSLDKSFGSTRLLAHQRPNSYFCLGNPLYLHFLL